MTLEVFVEKEKEGDMKGKYHVFIGEECSSGYKVYAPTVEQAAEEIRQYVLDNFKE